MLTYALSFATALAIIAAVRSVVQARHDRRTLQGLVGWTDTLQRQAERLHPTTQPRDVASSQQ